MVGLCGSKQDRIKQVHDIAKMRGASIVERIAAKVMSDSDSQLENECDEEDV